MTKINKKIEKFLTKQGYENVTFNKSTKYSDEGEEYIEVRADYVEKEWTYEGETKTFSDEYGTMTLTKGETFPERRKNNDIFRIYPEGKINGRNTYHITWDGVEDVMRDCLNSYDGISEVVKEFYDNTFEEIENYDQVSANILAV
tara:strand:- start:279 stop:713 length:435 start_codon:yes stop_codon:yes gene_type:complete